MNPANGSSLAGMGQIAGEILKISESSFVDHLNGILLNFVLPGAGGVLQVIGNLNFAEDTLSRRNTRGDTTASRSAHIQPVGRSHLLRRAEADALHAARAGSEELSWTMSVRSRS
jgi:hypothetical protein